MARINAFILLFMLLCPRVPAIEISDPAALSFAGLSASLSLPGSALFSNPAWLNHDKGFGFTASCHNPFNVTALYQGQVAADVNVFGFGTGVGASYLNADSLYCELAIVAGVSREFRRLRGGVSFECVSMAFEGEPPEYAPAMNLGAIALLPRAVCLSFAGRHIVSSALFGDAGALPRRFCGGISCSQQWFRTALEAEYERGYPVSVMFGQEVAITENFLIRAGLKSDPLTFGFGCAIGFRGFSAEAGFRTHPELGLSESAGFAFRKNATPQ